MGKYRVWLRSKPGFYEQYDGHVDVDAESIDDAPRVALDKLRRGVFSDRNSAMWNIEKVDNL